MASIFTYLVLDFSHFSHPQFSNMQKNKNFLASSQIFQCIVVPDKCLLKGITMFILKTQ